MRLKVILVFVLLASAISAYADELPELEDVVEKTMPAIVTVTTYKNPEQDLSEDSTIEIPKSLRHLFEAKEKSTVIDQTGTGFFISKNGYVITCLHIVSNAEKIQVSLYDKRKFSANIIARDSSLDLALLKVEGSSFSALDFETIKPLRTGAWVFVIGAPYGFDFSANVGIVSSNSRVLPTGDGSTHYIQTSIPISPGHSGSPVVNLSGKVVGVTSYIFTDQPGSIGISFALPAFQVEQISKKWIGRSNVN